MNGAGALVWPGGGIPICVAPNTQIAPRIVSDRALGAIVAWQDASGEIRWRLELPAAVDVFDASGRRLRRLASGCPYRLSRSGSPRIDFPASAVAAP